MSHSSEPAVIIVSGVMASGKSTVAQAGREIERGVHLRGDAFRRIIKGRKKCFRMLQTKQNGGSPCATDYRPPLPEPMLKRVFMSSSRTSFSAPRANNRNAKRPSVYVVVLNPSENAISAREQIRNKKATGYGPSMS